MGQFRAIHYRQEFSTQLGSSTFVLYPFKFIARLDLAYHISTSLHKALQSYAYVYDTPDEDS